MLRLATSRPAAPRVAAAAPRASAPRTVSSWRPTATRPDPIARLRPRAPLVAPVPAPPPAPRASIVARAKVCDLTGKRHNRARQVSFSHKRHKRVQHPNLQYKMVYWPEGQRYVRLRLSTEALRTVDRRGLQAMADEAGIDLWRLPFRDARPGRREWLAANAPHNPPERKRSTRMRNPIKIAASRRAKRVPRYYLGRIVFVREDKADGDIEDALG